MNTNYTNANRALKDNRNERKSERKRKVTDKVGG